MFRIKITDEKGENVLDENVKSILAGFVCEDGEAKKANLCSGKNLYLALAYASLIELARDVAQKSPEALFLAVRFIEEDMLTRAGT